MNKSIKLRILVILFALLAIFAVNAVMSGVTNNQVELSTTLLADYTVSLKSEQIELNKAMSTIENSALQYMLSPTTASAAVAQAKEATESFSDEVERIEKLVKKFADAEMNDALVDAYAPYKEALLNYAEVASNVITSVEKGDTKTAMTEYTKLRNLLSEVDEVGRIAIGINTFIEQLQSVLQSIQSGSNDIQGAAGKMGQNINDCENTSAAIFEGLREVSANMQEISTTLQNIDESASNILDSAKQIRVDSDANSKQVEYLLSYAGEAGKGFAVVASEIQKLSENTKEIATNIQQTNTVVLDSVHELVENANEMMAYITSTVLGDYDKFVENAVENQSGIAEISRLLVRFSQQAKRMEESTQALSDGITEISVASENSVNALMQSTEDMNTLHGAVAEIQSESNHNTQTAIALNSEVEKFRKI